MTLTILESGGNPLFGRDWLSEFRLPWFELKAIGTVSNQSSEEGKKNWSRS